MALINKVNLPDVEVKKKNVQNIDIDTETSGSSIWATYLKSFTEDNKYTGSDDFVDSVLTYAGVLEDYKVRGW